jgi:hypothetical protein
MAHYQAPGYSSDRACSNKRPEVSVDVKFQDLTPPLPMAGERIHEDTFGLVWQDNKREILGRVEVVLAAFPMN